MFPISNPIIFFSENNSPKLWNGLFQTNRKSVFARNVNKEDNEETP